MGNTEPDTAGRSCYERYATFQGPGALFKAKRRLDIHGLVLSVARSRDAVIGANLHGTGIGWKCRLAKETIASGFGERIDAGYGAYRQVGAVDPLGIAAFLLLNVRCLFAIGSRD